MRVAVARGLAATAAEWRWGLVTTVGASTPQRGGTSAEAAYGRRGASEVHARARREVLLGQSAVAVVVWAAPTAEGVWSDDVDDVWALPVRRGQGSCRASPSSPARRQTKRRWRR